MDRQTIFLLALGMLIAASLVVSVSGWVLWARERALHRVDARAAAGRDEIVVAAAGAT